MLSLCRLRRDNLAVVLCGAGEIRRLRNLTSLIYVLIIQIPRLIAHRLLC